MRKINNTIPVNNNNNVDNRGDDDDVNSDDDNDHDSSDNSSRYIYIITHFNPSIIAFLWRATPIPLRYILSASASALS